MRERALQLGVDVLGDDSLQDRRRRPDHDDRRTADERCREEEDARRCQLRLELLQLGRHVRDETMTLNDETRVWM